MPEINVRPRTLRTRMLLAGVAIGGTLAAGALSMPKAHADTDGLVAWAQGHGFTGSPGAIATRGALVCADLASGANGEGAAVDLWLNTGIVALVDAERFVVAAVEQLCPEFDHRHDAPAAPAPDFGAFAA